MNGVDDQVASIVLVTNSGLQELRSQLDAVRNQVCHKKLLLIIDLNFLNCLDEHDQQQKNI